jgi:hypothetical protein
VKLAWDLPPGLTVTGAPEKFALAEGEEKAFDLTLVAGPLATKQDFTLTLHAEAPGRAIAPAVVRLRAKK